MPTLRYTLLACALASPLACIPELELDVPENLPQRVHFRTATESFNAHWYLALRDGRIWVKGNEETGNRDADWELLGATGRPEGGGLVRFDEPTWIDEISADGVHVQALSDAGVFYRGSNLQTDVRRSLTWTDKWGWPAGDGEGLVAEFGTERGWDVSDSHPSNVAEYSDINDQDHSVGLGVAHLYRLGPEGRRIYFNDWWLPNDWSRQICGPERGALQALNLSASGSTLFVVGAGGAMYTRLYDFDTAGENDLYTYSYVVEGPAGTTRALPAEPWRRQPDIEDGRATSRITIFQDGKGSSARVLRVEGARDGVVGYFAKRIDDDYWVFHETGAEVAGPFLDELPPPPVAEPGGATLSATLSRESSELTLDVVVHDFDIVCSPARVTLRAGDGVLTAGGEPVELTLHHVHTLVDEPRATDYWDDGTPATIRAALLVPSAVQQIDDAAALLRVTELLDGREVINLVGEATPTGLELTEIRRSMSFRVPAEEKGYAGELFGLVAGP